MPCGPEASVPPHTHTTHPTASADPTPALRPPTTAPTAHALALSLVKGQGPSHHTGHTHGSGPPRATARKTLLLLSMCVSVPAFCKAVSDSPQPLQWGEAWWQR